MMPGVGWVRVTLNPKPHLVICGSVSSAAWKVVFQYRVRIPIYDTVLILTMASVSVRFFGTQSPDPLSVPAPRTNETSLAAWPFNSKA